MRVNQTGHQSEAMPINNLRICASIGRNRRRRDALDLVASNQNVRRRRKLTMRPVKDAHVFKDSHGWNSGLLLSYRAVDDDRPNHRDSNRTWKSNLHRFSPEESPLLRILAICALRRAQDNPLLLSRSAAMNYSAAIKDIGK